MSLCDIFYVKTEIRSKVAIFCVETEIRSKVPIFCVKTETISKFVMFWFGLTVVSICWDGKQGKESYFSHRAIICIFDDFFCIGVYLMVNSLELDKY